jgi:phosphoglycerol transferase MdoB-like AlkP superfamily enzyme
MNKINSKKTTLFSKENVVYLILTIIAISVFSCIKGWSYTIKYISILCGLFIPLFIVIETNSIIFSLYKKESIPILKVIIYISSIVFSIIIFLILLEENQSKMLFTISSILSILLLIVLVIVTYRK